MAKIPRDTSTAPASLKYSASSGIKQLSSTNVTELEPGRVPARYSDLGGVDAAGHPLGLVYGNPRALDRMASVPARYALGGSKYSARVRNSPDDSTALDLFETCYTDHKKPEKGHYYVVRPMGPGSDGLPARSTANALPSNIVMLDNDVGWSSEDFHTVVLPQLKDYLGFLHLTHSSTPERIRWRGYFFLNKEVDRRTLQALSEAWGGARGGKPGLLGALSGTFDTALYRAEQPSYLPPPGASFYLCNGALLDADYLAQVYGPLPAGRARQPVQITAETVAATEQLLRRLEQAGLWREETNYGKHALTCPWVHEHTGGDPTGTVYIEPNEINGGKGAFRCLHNSCKDRRLPDLLDELELRDANARGAAYNDRHAVLETAGTVGAPETLADALARLVYINSKNAVCDRARPRLVQPIEHISTDMQNRQVPYVTANGQVRHRPLFRDWLQHRHRVNVEGVTWYPTNETFVQGKDGERCFNTHIPLPAPTMPYEEARERARPFLEHVRWLWEENAEPFLDWLAHIVQKPEVMPHYAHLHVAIAHGMGRNWVTSVLQRALRHLMGSNMHVRDLLGDFTSHQAGKLLLSFDEFDTSGSKYNDATLIRTMITAEYKLLNEKYGKQYYVANRARLLLLTNYLNSMPVDHHDRRIYVSTCEDRPRNADYYTWLYNHLRDDELAVAVRDYLAQRDISQFNPGARAPASEIKLSMVDDNNTDADDAVIGLIRNWPVPYISAPTLKHVVRKLVEKEGGDPNKVTKQYLSHLLPRHGIRRLLQGFDHPDGKGARIRWTVYALPDEEGNVDTMKGFSTRERFDRYLELLQAQLGVEDPPAGAPGGKFALPTPATSYPADASAADRKAWLEQLLVREQDLLPGL